MDKEPAALSETAEEERQTQPGDFPIDVQAMMADYESQIAAKSREAMLERMKNLALQTELNSIKETLMGLQGRASGLPTRPVVRKKPVSRKR